MGEGVVAAAPVEAGSDVVEELGRGDLAEVEVAAKLSADHGLDPLRRSPAEPCERGDPSIGTDRQSTPPRSQSTRSIVEMYPL